MLNEFEEMRRLLARLGELKGEIPICSARLEKTDDSAEVQRVAQQLRELHAEWSECYFQYSLSLERFLRTPIRVK